MPMKVLYILNATSRLSGSFKSFMIMLSGLMERGIEPILVLPKDTLQDYENLLRDKGFSVVVLVYKFHAWPHSQTWREKVLFFPRLVGRLFFNYLAECLLARRFRNEDIAFIHTNVSTIGIGYRLSRRFGIPHIYHIREYGDKDFGICHFPTSRTFTDSLRQADSYSIFITRDIQQYYGLCGWPTSSVIYNGVHDRVEEMIYEAGKSYFLFVGPISRAKGIDQLVEAYCNYADRVNTMLPLYIVGDVVDLGLFRQLEILIHKKNIQDKVLFLGKRTDVEFLMQKACALVVPSVSEGFGRCMPEAMFNATLVIGRDTGGTKEQMDNGLKICGEEIALRYDTTEQLTKLLTEVTEAPKDKYNTMIKHAFDVVNQLYTNENYIEQVYRFYQKINKGGV